MPQPDEMKERVRKLEEDVRILQIENDLLTERAEDTMLLGLIAEEISGADEMEQVLECGLEKISVLKDIPFCACCFLAGNKAVIVKSYLSFTNQDMSNRTIFLPETSPMKIEAGRCLLSGNECRQAGIELAAANFVPVSAICIPFKSRFSGVNMFFFADDKSGDRLLRGADMLHRVAEIMASRVDNISLFQELRSLNRELDRKVEERTTELRESESRFRQFFENEPAYCYMVSSDGVILDVNKAALNVLGYRKEELVGEPLQTIYAPESHGKMRQSLNEWKATGKISDAEMVILSKSGKKRTVLLSANAMRDAEGKTVYSISVQQDITEHKQADEALQESESRFRSFFQRNNAVMLLIDPDTGDIIDANPSATRFYGYSREALCAMKIQDINILSAQEVAVKRRQVLTGESNYFVFPHRLADGRVRTVEVHSTPIAARGKPLLFSIINDITDRKQFEEQLFNVAKGVSASSGDTFFRSLVEHLAGALGTDYAFIGEIINEPPGRIRTVALYADGKIVDNIEYDLAGTPCENVAGKSLCTYPSGVQDLFPQDHLLQEMGIESYSGTPLFGSAGRALGILVVLHRHPFKNIAQLESMVKIFAVRAASELERSYAESELQKSSTLLRAVIDAAPTAIIGLDLDGNVQGVWNSAAEKLLGWSAGEVMGRPLPDVPEDGQDQFRLFNEQIRCGKTIDGIEVRRQRRDGSHVDYNIYAAPLRDTGGLINGSIAVLVDITEKKRLEKEREGLIKELQDLIAIVSRSQKEWQQTFDSITDLIFLSDMDFNVTRVNRAAEWFLHKPLIEVLGTKCHELIHGTAMVPEFCYGCKTIGSGKTTIVERYEEHLGRYLEIRVIPRFGMDGKLIGLIHVIRDLTEHKKLEEQLAQVQKMEAVGQLAGGIAHDFNNILTSVISCGNLLRMKLDKEDRLSTYVNFILDASDKGASLVRGLLAFSRKEKIYPSPVDLNEIIARVEPLAQKTITEDVALQMALTDDVLTVMADKTQIEEVLINLVANARDAMPAGGKITIRTERVNLSADIGQTEGHPKAGVFALMSVSDTGAGMDDKTKERVFEPFFTTKEVGRGTGLGLSIVYGIVKQHGGFVDIHSVPDEGTTVEIYLPLVPAHLEDEKEEEPTLPQGGSETLLLAEDDSIVRSIVKNLLEEFGYEVIAAVDGEEAVKMFEEYRDTIRLAVLDVVMPRMNGREAYEKIKAISPGIKTIFLSGYTSDILQGKFIFEDGLHFLQKPVSPFDLLVKIREVLDS